MTAATRPLRRVRGDRRGGAGGCAPPGRTQAPSPADEAPGQPDIEQPDIEQPTSVLIEQTTLESLVARVAVEVVAALAQQTAGATPWMTTSEAAEYLRCRPDRLKVLASQGRIPVTKEGARNLYHRDALDRWLTVGEASLER